MKTTVSLKYFVSYGRAFLKTGPMLADTRIFEEYIALFNCQHIFFAKTSALRFKKLPCLICVQVFYRLEKSSKLHFV